MAAVTLVKLGGSTLGQHDTSLDDLAALHNEGHRLVVVHGGGRIISGWLERYGVESRFVRGLRVTGETALDVVTAVLAGLVNKQIVAALQARGASAIGISGVDGGLLTARRIGEGLGYVGEIVEVGCSAAQNIVDAGAIAVIAPLAMEKGSSQILNVNADTAAGILAAAMGVNRLVFLTDVPGVIDDSGQPIERLASKDARVLLERSTITGGMIPKIEAAISACAAGVQTIITDGRQPGALCAAAAERAGGTLIEDV